MMRASSAYKSARNASNFRLPLKIESLVFANCLGFNVDFVTGPLQSNFSDVSRILASAFESLDSL